jgi:hypothetical protein
VFPIDECSGSGGLQVFWLEMAVVLDRGTMIARGARAVLPPPRAVTAAARSRLAFLGNYMRLWLPQGKEV